jgi:hypothetical protein
MTEPRRFTFRLSAGHHERFTEGAAQSMVGQTPRLKTRLHEDGPVLNDFGSGAVVAAELVEGGNAVLLTVETQSRDLLFFVERGVIAAMSFKPTEITAVLQPAEPAPADGSRQFKTWFEPDPEPGQLKGTVHFEETITEGGERS